MKMKFPECDFIELKTSNTASTNNDYVRPLLSWLGHDRKKECSRLFVSSLVKSKLYLVCYLVLIAPYYKAKDIPYATNENTEIKNV